MGLGRIHKKLTSLAVSVMLTSAFLASPPSGMSAAAAGPQPQAIMNMLSSIRASGWAGTAEMEAPANAGVPQTSGASAEGPILSAAQRQVLMNLMAVYGHETALSPVVTAALGITKGDEVLTLRQLNVSEPPFRHGYTPLPDGGVMLIFRDGGAPCSYRLDASLKLIAAVSKAGKEEPIVIPIPDAERTVQSELSYWAAIADKN